MADLRGCILNLTDDPALIYIEAKSLSVLYYQNVIVGILEPEGKINPQQYFLSIFK